jgi:hypothetical protein
MWLTECRSLNSTIQSKNDNYLCKKTKVFITMNKMICDVENRASHIGLHRIPEHPKYRCIQSVAKTFYNTGAHREKLDILEIGAYRAYINIHGIGAYR